MTNWGEVEATLRRLARPAVAAFAGRAARRVAPVVATLADRYGPEAAEWLNAADAAVRVVEAFAGGAAVSPFTLQLAADIARSAASATANAARARGPSPRMEDAELAYAAAAFAADAARAADDARAASLAVRAAQMAANGGPPTAEQASDLRALAEGSALDPLWPDGEPDWWRDGRDALERGRRSLPSLIELPAAGRQG